MKTKRYLITGGTGFIGSALVRRFVKEGFSVCVLDNDSRGSKERLADVYKDIEFIKGDIRDPQVVRRACRKIDCVYHLAYVNGTEFFYSMPDVVLDVGVNGMMNVMDACLKENVGEMILASSSEVYQKAAIVPTDESVGYSIPDPLNPRYSYACGKIISESILINYGRKYFKRVIIFRPHNVYGHNMGWEHVIPQFILRMCRLISRSPKAKEINFPIHGSGKETRAFVFIDDFIDGVFLLNEKGKHMNIYHIGSQEEITIIEVAKHIGRYFGKNVKIIPGKAAKGGTPRRCPDISKMKALGYKPQYKFSKGLDITARWYNANAQLSPYKRNKTDFKII